MNQTAGHDDRDRIDRIADIRRRLGGRLLILTHHYQRKEIVDLGDFRGDSFALSKNASERKDVEHIVFCGVHFMAESAAILARPHQIVQIPDTDAGCWMADMIDNSLTEGAWREIAAVSGPESVTPVVYVNSDAHIKAFCGRNGGVTCTSSNAAKAFEWSWARREKILFLPDRHLGHNTAMQTGVRPEEMIVWDPGKTLGGNTEEAIRGARLILWNGYCLVHTRFTTDHIRRARLENPDARIVVHPECAHEVVECADAAGSTGFIVDYVRNSAPDAGISIGTEINLIERLMIEHPDKKIRPLHRSLCPNMFKITPEKLLHVLEHIGEANVVEVEESVKDDARKALERMLTL